MLAFLWGPLILAASAILSGCRDDSLPAPSGTPPDTGALPSRTLKTQPEESAPPPPAKPFEPCPPEMAKVDAVCVDRYESHLTVNGQPFPHNWRPAPGLLYNAASAMGFLPQAYINREESAFACRNAGKRLCSLEEWLHACKGRSNRLYSYGNEEEAKRCNKGKPHLLAMLFQDVDPMTWGYDTHFNNPLLNLMPDFLAKTADYRGCVSDYGIFDMIGNLHEWVSTRVSRDLPRRIHLNQALTKKLNNNLGNGIFMGGFYSTTSEHGSGCEFITIGHEATYHDYSTGFRCCKDAAVENVQ